MNVWAMLFAAVLYVLLRDYTTECLWLMISKNMDYLPALLVDQGLISALFPTDLSDSTLSYTETEAASSPNITPGEFSGTCLCFTYSGQMSSFDMFFFFFYQFHKLISRGLKCMKGQCVNTGVMLNTVAYYGRSKVVWMFVHTWI